MRNPRRARLVLTVLLLLALTLITLDFRQGPNSKLKSIGSSIFGPIENGLSDVFHPIGSFFSGLGHLNSYERDNQKLRDEVQSLRDKLAQEQPDQQRYQDLEALDGLAHDGGYTIVHANVVSVGTGLSFDDTATIDVGSLDGVKREMTVMNGLGLVGRIVRVSRISSTVLLADDPSFRTGADVESSLTLCLVNGRGLNPMSFNVLYGSKHVVVGDRLVTSGGGSLAPEVPIGTVTFVKPGSSGENGQVGQLQPFVDFSSLDYVAVILTTKRTHPRLATLPPKPSQSPSPSTTTTGTGTGTGTIPPGTTPTGTTPTGTATTP